MNLLNIIDTIYESKYFPTMLIIAIIVLVVLFVSVTILGMKDSNKFKVPKRRKKEELVDITFDSPKKEDFVKEDVTFEIPILTQNLENFKKSLEEEIEREAQINVIKKSSLIEQDTKTKKILDKKAIESTDVLPIIETASVPVVKEKNVIDKKEDIKPQHREVFKEIFKDRSEKNVEPPKIKEDDKVDEQIKKEESRVGHKSVIKKQTSKIEIDDVLEKTKTQRLKDSNVIEKKSESSSQQQKVSKKEQRYSVDDDF